MQMDSRSSHPRILRGRASEVFFDKSASGGERAKPPEADLSKNYARSPPADARV